MKARLFGLVALALAAGAGWWGIWLPLAAAQAGAERIDYSLEAFVLAPFAGVYGLFFLILGERAVYRDPVRQRFSTAGWIVLALAALASGGAYWWFKSQVEPLGYWASGMPRRPVGPFVPDPIPSPPRVTPPSFP